MKAKKVVAIGGLAAAGGGAALLIGRLSGSRWAGRVVGDGYRPTGAAARAFSANGGSSDDWQTDRWLAVTVNRPPQEIPTEDGLPGPLADLGDGVEVRIQPAPADKGTEISALPRGSSSKDYRQKVRKALRETKQILETGEVLSPDWPPTTKDTPGGKLLGAATSRSRREGLL